MPNPFVHVELNTTDVKKAKDFYGKLFQWKLEDVPMGPMTYTMIQVGKDSGGVGGGIMQQQHPGAPTAWLSYVVVDDIHESTKKARSLGATIAQDVTPVADMGIMSVIIDPTGGHLGLWQPKNQS